jgi:hypothetical protein
MQEFIGEDDGTAAPRLAETRPDPAELARLWRQLVRALTTMAGLGLAHGDLSAYNLLVHRGRLIMIDLPQVVDVIAHPRGAEFLDRDAANVARWFTARGLTADLLASTPASDPPRTPADRAGPGGRRGPGAEARGLTAEFLASTPGDRAAGPDTASGAPPAQTARPSPGGRRGTGAGARGLSSGDPGRPGGGAGRADPVPGPWAKVPAPEDLGRFLLQEARLV